MKLFTAVLASAMAGLADGLGSTDTITWGGDNSRTGYQTNHNMDPAIVGSSQFDQLFKTSLPGNYLNVAEQIFSQPLVYTPSKGTTQYVYWATSQNNVYKMNAQTGEIVASRNLHIPFLTADLDGCVDINPCIGVTATGVIDPATDTLYLTAKTYLKQDAGPIAQGRPAGRYYIHALDVNDLSERPNFPVNLEGLIATNNPERMFTGGIHHQRPGLLHTGKFIYVGFASHCVQYNFTGWIIGFDKTSGNIVERWATQGKGVPADVKGGGIWMSGGGLSSDDAGSMFFATGNGYASQLATIPVNGFDPPTSMEEAAVHMNINDDGSLKIVDFFMPYEKQELDGGDKDLGTSPLEMLPSQFSCGDIKRMGVVTGKSGKTYWLNLDNLGGYRNGLNQKDNVIQVFQNENSVYAGAGVYPLEGGYIYINVIQYPTHVFKFSCTNDVPSFTKVADSPTNNAYILGVGHGTVTSLNGQEGTGLVWTTDVQGVNFKIYKAIPKDGNMVLLRSFTISGITKFTRPVFGDGIAYIGTTQGVVYGYGSLNKSPLNCTSPIDFGSIDVSSASSQQTVTCKALIDVSITGIALEDDTNYAISGVPSVPLAVIKGNTFTVKAKFSPKSVGRQAGNIIVNATITGDDSYSKSTNARLTGVGQSSGALLTVSPKSVSFSGVIAGQDPDGETVLLNNDGSSSLDITSVLYSTESATTGFTAWSGSGNLKFSKFMLQNIPSKVAGNKATAVTIQLDAFSVGTYQGWVKFVSTGGNGTVSITGAVGAAPVALFEFQKPDGSGWVAYDAKANFTFGNVTENTSRSLKFRVTNNAPQNGVKLSLTVSKPPFGVSGIIRAVNQVDLAEGTSLAAGQSATAVLTCTVPKSQWNLDPFNGTAQWTMNTNDPNLDKQFIQFFCNAVTEQAPPLLSNGQGRYRYIGCYKENNPGRQLSNQILATDTLTTAICIKACGDKGNIFCGTQYHRECWAGDKIPTLKVDDLNCNFDCAADLNGICGGNGVGSGAGGAYISLFADILQYNTSSSSTTTTTTATAAIETTLASSFTSTAVEAPKGPFVNPGANGYHHIGCYTEGKTGRALPNGRDNNDPTVAKCILACKTGSFLYAGLEYGGEARTPFAFLDLSDCKMTCNGNTTEYCGDGNRLNVYQRDDISSSTSTSIASSVAASSATSSTTSSIATSVPSITSTSTTTTTTTTSAKATATGPQINDKIGTWDFQGCWTEAANGRALNSKTYAKDDMTLDSCAAFCDGYDFFGVEYGRECYCGSKPNTGSVKADNQKDCSFICPGDKTQYCGAGNRLQLYTKATVVASSTSSLTPSTSLSTIATSSDASASSTIASTKTTDGTTVISTTTSASKSATPSIFEGNKNFTNYSCISEPSNGRLLGKQVLNDNKMTIKMCLESCYDYKFAGVEYGVECWCGNTLNLNGNTGATPGKNVSDSDCNFRCPGDTLVFCGAGNRLNMYINNITSSTSTMIIGTSTTTAKT
ncbi:hypothetical protein AK830_g3796 [Neonectria ditissima]|uniref:WSC domain-containing protein n=1 Tax=Neonectria ditissima TaxID=78410 RepID=A0A0N8H7U3_9HYPO|nr:hypothetical protein AK830_g3796 [Neonectria ditissima]